ncbi:MAG: TatD family hydrolase [Alphaproteobacteria bacterium]
MSLVDSHCHLDFTEFAPEIDAVIARAKAAGVAKMVSISTRLSTFPNVRAIAEAHDDVYCSVGVHPHEAKEEGAEASAEKLIRLAEHKKVIGVGETGLDFYYEHSPREEQEAAFRAHITAARETGLPVIVHTREAEADTARVLRDEMEKGAFTGLIHCFTSSRQLAEAALELGLYISFSGIVTFKNAGDLREVARIVPADRILVETDAPFLAPVPHRGRRNEPAFVVQTARTLAEVRGVSEAEIATQTTANFGRLFTRVNAGQGNG